MLWMFKLFHGVHVHFYEKISRKLYNKYMAMSTYVCTFEVTHYLFNNWFGFCTISPIVLTSACVYKGFRNLPF